MAGKLTVRSVESLTLAGRPKPGRHTDGDGLHLHVRATGDATWVLRYRHAGRQRDLGLGPCPTISLKQAREAATAARALLKDGKDPVLERQRSGRAIVEAASRERSFKAAAEAFIEAKRAGWRSPVHAKQWAATLDAYAYPVFGTWPVQDLDTDAVLRALKPVWTRAPETASRLRGRIEAILDFARARGWRSGENPARWRGHLAELLPPPRKVRGVEHQPSLAWAEMPKFMSALVDRRGMAALALRFAILCASRTGEVRHASWAEIDHDAKIWTIPGKRMKAGKIHRVPLSEAALAVLAEVAALREGSTSLLFPGAKSGKPLSDMSLSMLVRGMAADGLATGAPPRWRDVEGRAVVPHGFRSTFKGWSLAHGWADHLSEIALAHTDKDKVRAAYARAELVEERRAMMDAWAVWCSKQVGAAGSDARNRCRPA